ncbi:MAG TPA: hypothetical protein VGR68_07510 [Actinomycetota bacterium]|nr:hypothetical protein [Actinomycetota bacterium]
MSVDADHQVIDSPEALFRHLYEDHQVEEVRDLDPLAAPLHFWLRRHAELERDERAAAAAGQPRPPAATGQDQGGRPAPPGQHAPGAAGREGRRPAAFADPLVEALARALIGRGHDEAAVRGAIRAHATRDGTRAGEAAVRADLVEPMLRAAAERLLGTRRPDPAGAPPPDRADGTPPPDRADGAPPPDRADGAPPPDRAERERPEAAWAGLWADLAGGGAGRRAEAAAAGPQDDLMAVADAVQRPRARPARGRGDAGGQSR